MRNGLAADGRQRYLCRECGQRSREQPRTNAYREEEREQILRAYDERSSLRGLSRTFGVSRQTVTGWLKAHVERWNLTLRQRLARFVRRTLSFSKSSQMHEACLRLFIHRYNCSHALTLT